jgi:hypothetical protein
LPESFTVNEVAGHCASSFERTAGERREHCPRGSRHVGHAARRCGFKPFERAAELESDDCRITGMGKTERRRRGEGPAFAQEGVAQLEVLDHIAPVAALHRNPRHVYPVDAQPERQARRRRPLPVSRPQPHFQRLRLQRADAGAPAEEGEELHAQAGLSKRDRRLAVDELDAAGLDVSGQGAGKALQLEPPIGRRLGTLAGPLQAGLGVEQPPGGAGQRGGQEQQDGQDGEKPLHQKL